MSLLVHLVLLSLFNLVSSDKKEETLSYTTGESHVFVFDKLIHPTVANYMQYFLVRNSSFSYYYPDPYEKDDAANDGNLYWSAPVSPQLLIKMRIWGGIRNAYRSLPDEVIQGRKYLPYLVYGTLLRRGDFTIPFQGDAEKNDSIFVRVFLTKNMKKNIYSDQTFYDGNDEIIASVHPRFARIIMWTGNVSTLIRPPSMGYEQAEYSLFLKLTPRKELFEKACNDHIQHQHRITEYKSLPFPYTNHVNKYDIENMDLSQHLLGKYYDQHGNVVAYFDNVLPKELIDELRTYLTHYEAGFSYNPHDPATSETHDNVNWILQFSKVETVLNTPYWSAVKKISAYLSNTTLWYPYDVSCNLIQHTHHTRIHIDCTNNEFEYTFLLYLNPYWNENMYAETAFFNYVGSDSDDGKSEPDVGSKDYERYDFLSAAIPKFGRMAVFRNLIPHSARPPSPNFLAARYTFPVKVSESFEQARAKMLMEALDYKRDDMPEDPLYAALRKGNYHPYLQDDKREWVEKHLEAMQDAKKKATIDETKSAISILIPENHRTGL